MIEISKIRCEDCIEGMKEIESDSIDSCVTDPPYFLTNDSGKGFMNKQWDSTHNDYEFHYQWATELYRILKPGGHVLIFGGSRTFHRMVCAVEDANFQIRDTICWVFGSGFPKSLNISKQIDKIAGTKRKVISKGKSGKETTHVSSLNMSQVKNNTFGGEYNITTPSSEEAIRWSGWGSALKPAVELICLARKPLSEKNIALNVLKHGTGGINIDKCRIGCDEVKTHGGDKFKGDNIYGKYNTCEESVHQGRFPANLILECCCEEDELMESKTKSGGGKTLRGETSFSDSKDSSKYFNYGDEKGNERCLVHTNPDCVCRMLDDQSGITQSSKVGFNGVGWKHSGNTKEERTELKFQREFNDKGGSSRFFYQAKASQKERWFYCTICKKAFQMAEKENHIHDAPESNKYTHIEFHPTQKPLELLKYLVRLITPPKWNCIRPLHGNRNDCSCL